MALITHTKSCLNFLGGHSRFSPSLIRIWIESARFIEFLLDEPLPPPPPLKEFKKKNPEFEKLDRYDLDPGDTFWNRLPVNPIPTSPTTRVNFTKLEEIALDLGYTKLDLLYAVISNLRDGADTMVGGVGLTETYCEPSGKALFHPIPRTDQFLDDFLDETNKF